MQTTNWRWYIITAKRFGDIYYLRNTDKIEGMPHHAWTTIEGDAVSFSDLKTAQREAKKIDGAKVLEQFVCPSCNATMTCNPDRFHGTTECTRCGHGQEDDHEEH